MGARFNGWWVAMWVASCAVLLAMFVGGCSPAAFVTAMVVLFGVPEAIGLVHRGDSLPPLTYTVRRFVPRFAPDIMTVAIGAWMAAVWIPTAHHRALVALAIGGTVGFLLNHWDVTYDGPGE